MFYFNTHNIWMSEISHIFKEKFNSINQNKFRIVFFYFITRLFQIIKEI
ncbi:unnamed protein product [Paramecium primaurelia]|uniref:Uncharacterized protein n=1 Tax=Paramecium primaurelia TaxID=5886 RepID=A0A8S1LFV2_PARPR|nr:unnamed protein product [Paramecium primaurelia]